MLLKKNLATCTGNHRGWRCNPIPLVLAKQSVSSGMAVPGFTLACTFKSRKFRIINYTSGALSGLLLSVAAEGFDESRLWLPISYQTHYLKLKEAAASAESLERCEEILSGTLDRDQSSRDHPIFRITCRQPDGQSYNEMVDGLSFETLTTSRETKYKLTEEELAQQKLAEERRKRAEKERTALSACEGELQQRVKGMKNIQWLDGETPEPVSGADGELVFTIDFDAEAFGGEALHYRSTCQFRSPTDFNLKIGKR